MSTSFSAWPIRALWWSCLIAISSALVFHFAIIEIWNLPMNPISLDLQAKTRWYARTYFMQNWNFFAPQPIDRSEGLIARARLESHHGLARTTAWLDVSAPLTQAVADDRFTSLGLVELLLSNSVTNFVNTAAKDPDATVTRKGTKFYKQLIPLTVDPIDSMILMRTAAAAIANADPDQRFSEIQVGTYTDVFPRFTERFHDDDGKHTTWILLPWQPFPKVAPFSVVDDAAIDGCTRCLPGRNL
jgi:Family of unknown function (DUF5819)